MNPLIYLLLLGIIIYSFRNNKADIQKDNLEKKTMEEFNNYTILYILSIIHDHFEKNKIWYILIGDTLHNIVENKDIPVFGQTGTILANKSEENKIIELKNSLEKINLYINVNLNSIEIKTRFNKNISVMIYLVNNNNGMLDICTTNEHLECKTKCCKIEGSNIDFSKLSIRYSYANPRQLYKVKDLELYGPNKYKPRAKDTCLENKVVYKNNNKREVLLNEYIAGLMGKDSNIIQSKNISTKGMYKINPLHNVKGYNSYKYLRK